MKLFGIAILGLVWIVFIWFLVASYFNDYKTECPSDQQMKMFLTDFGEERIQTTESCFEGCALFIKQTGYQIMCEVYCL